jgi:hypothetical protein
MVLLDYYRMLLSIIFERRNSMQLASTGVILVILSIVPLFFLLYSLANLEKLNITITHPRVIVEIATFLLLLLSGLVLWLIA